MIRLIIKDYSSHCMFLNESGGAYWFTTVYELQENGLWEVSYDTSCGYFDYCVKYGYFTNCDNTCSEWVGEDGCELKKVTFEEVLKDLLQAIEDPLKEVALRIDDNRITLKEPATTCGKCYPSVMEDDFKCSYDY